MARILRTPEERFEHLPSYEFEPRYVEDLVGYEGLRCHYICLLYTSDAADE